MRVGQAGASHELALRFIQNVALGFEAHRSKLPLFASVYNDLKAKVSTASAVSPVRVVLTPLCATAPCPLLSRDQGVVFPRIDEGEVHTLASLPENPPSGALQEYGFDIDDGDDDDLPFDAVARAAPLYVTCCGVECCTAVRDWLRG